mmetsp:Transcript_12850/g.26234  ORF Transcript_12850/g.26234 Transcript_12850/m.26234 type:complete len:102 (-) Transcript_12850:135-440(-)
MSQLTTAVGSSFIIFLCCSVAVSNSGRRVSYIPPALRKSGIPDEVLTPAPDRRVTEGEVRRYRPICTISEGDFVPPAPWRQLCNLELRDIREEGECKTCGT